MVLTIADDAKGKNQRNITVEPVANERELRLWHWVEQNRALVEKKTDGKVLQQLSIDDPRVIRVPMLPGSAQGHQFVVRDEGDFMLVLPAQPDASVLQLQWAETPGQPVQANSPQQQLSLQQFAAELQLK